MKKLFIYLFFFLNLGIIIFFWWTGTGKFIFANLPSFLDSLSHIFGLLAVYSVLIQFLLMGRSIWIEKVFGLDKIARVHKLNGYFSISFILLHFILVTLGHGMDVKLNFWDQFVIFITSFEDVLQAFIALILFVVIVFFSIYIVRRRLKYEFWYGVHLLTYVAIVLAWGHQLKNGEDFAVNKLFVFYWYALYIFVFANVLIFRFIKPWFNTFKHQFYVSDLVRENNEVISIYISGKDMQHFHKTSGQFMIFRFLTKGLWWETHPFSLSWSADHKSIRITPKQLGDFTNKLSNLKKGTKVYIDGPYGIFTKDVLHSTKVLLIAGGIGITPIRSLIEDFAKQKLDIIVLYTNKFANEIVFKKELDELSKKYRFPIYYVTTQDEKYKGEKGRIDQGKLTRLVPDFKTRDIYICGPQAMIDTTKDLLRKNSVPENQIHFEKFAL
jgi:predicted ferric reductase